MVILYDLFFLIFSFIYIPYLFINKKWHKGFWLRLGYFQKGFSNILKGQKNIWIHTVSVGEVMAVLDLINKIKIKYPHHRIVLSTVTKTGNELAKDKLSKNDIIIYAPLDFSLIVKKFIKTINPILYVSAETEIWPNLYTALKKENIPIIQVNGRISEKGFKGYSNIGFLISGILKNVSSFCMQSEMDGKRIIKLGADRSKVKILGNLKFDITFDNNLIEKKNYGFSDQDLIFIGGSTHPGEEEILLEIMQKLKKDFSALRLIIAPRHIERCQEIEKIAEVKGFKTVRFSQINSSSKNPDTVIIVDTIGHLRSLYNMATIVFIGKTLCGIGGQNIIEPAYYGKPIFIGPHTENFRDVVDLFLKEKAIFRVQNKEDLYAQISVELKNRIELEKKGNKAKKIVESCKGATEKTLNEIGKFL